MRRTGRGWGILLAAAAFVALSAILVPGAFAQGSDVAGADDQVVLTGRLVVPEGESVQTAIIVNGDALIEGTVLEELVVFNGRTEITGTVTKDVVSFNGAVVVGPGALVGGDVISREDPQIDPGATVRGNVQGLAQRLDFPQLGLEARLAWWIGYSISSLVLGLVLLRLAPALDGASDRALNERLGGVFGFGILMFVLLPIVAVLLFVTLVAIPLGVFLLLALGLLYSIGYVVGLLALGRLVLAPPRSRYLAFFAAWAAFRLTALVPVFGGFAWTITSLIGLGVVWVASRPTPEDTVPMASPPPAPASA